MFSSNLCADEIKIGMSTALTGPIKDVGQNMRIGVETYFNKINQTGGVNGNSLKLIVKDDGYEPRNTVLNMRELIDEHDVMAIIGNVGTPTSLAALPIANKAETLFFAAFTGAKELRKKKHFGYVLNYRASYEQEVEEMVSGLIGMGIKPEEMAFFTQRDSFGDAGYAGGLKVLRKHGFDNPEKLAHGRYTRNTVNIERAVADLVDMRISPKAVLMFGSYEPSARFIKLAKQDFPDLIFLNSSFVGGQALANSLGDDTENVIVMQVVPSYKSNLPAAVEYRQDVMKYSPTSELNYVSFEGYISAKILVEALRNEIVDLSKQSIIDGLYKLTNLDIGIGLNVGFSAKSNQAVDKVWPTIYKDKKFQAFNWGKDLSGVVEAQDKGHFP